MAVGSFSVPLAKADFVPAGESLDQQHALCILALLGLWVLPNLSIVPKTALQFWDLEPVHVKILL